LIGGVAELENHVVIVEGADFQHALFDAIDRQGADNSAKPKAARIPTDSGGLSLCIGLPLQGRDRKVCTKDTQFDKFHSPQVEDTLQSKKHSEG
jgi:hypothetical protein